MLIYVCKYLKFDELIASFLRYTLLVICRSRDLSFLFLYVKFTIDERDDF